MTQNEHNLIAGIILFIFWQIIYHKILKHHPVAKKNAREWMKILSKYF